MNKLLKQLQTERGALIRRRDLALGRKLSFEDKLASLRTELRQAESRLRSAKKAALVGGPAKLETAEEAALVRTLTEGPVSDAAFQDVIADTQKQIGEIDAAIHAKETAVINARMDEVEVELLHCRVEDLELTAKRESLRQSMTGMLEHWKAGERSRRALGDTSGRPHPEDIPDHYARDPQGHERSREETRSALTTRIDELNTRLDGKEANRRGGELSAATTV